MVNLLRVLVSIVAASERPVLTTGCLDSPMERKGFWYHALFFKPDRMHLPSHGF
jgi:hypothetical protein